MYEKEYKKIKKNKKYFEYLLNLLKDDGIQEEIKFKIAKNASEFATFCHTGYFYSNVLEKYFVEIAQSLHTYIVDDYLKDSCLHVMTRAYTTGGHTRVVERWLDLYNKTSKQSVLLINQGSDTIPEKLKRNVRLRNGDLIILDSSIGLKERALQLRKIASEYAYVVLHTHMQDPTATIAFGTEEFKRPILLFNHADHMFWLGRAIVDVVLDMRSIKCLTKECRCIYDSKICNIPVETTNDYLRKEEARKELNLVQDNKKLILLSGTSFKFATICGDNILDVLENLVKSDIDLRIIILGIEKKQKEFEILKTRYPDKILLVSKQPFEVYKKYVSSADLIIDSYPMSGGTALIDATCAGVPYLSLENYIGQMDSVIESSGYCTTKEELITKTLKILRDDTYTKQILFNESEVLKKYADEAKWIQNINNIIEELPKRHKLRDIKSTKAPNFINDYAVVLNFLYNRNNAHYWRVKIKINLLRLKNILNYFYRR